MLVVGRDNGVIYVFIDIEKSIATFGWWRNALAVPRAVQDQAECSFVVGVFACCGS